LYEDRCGICGRSRKEDPKAEDPMTKEELDEPTCAHCKKPIRGFDSYSVIVPLSEPRRPMSGAYHEVCCEPARQAYLLAEARLAEKAREFLLEYSESLLIALDAAQWETRIDSTVKLRALMKEFGINE
jgi:hypothetical protein